jgi:hypothetical protein
MCFAAYSFPRVFIVRYHIGPQNYGNFLRDQSFLAFFFARRDFEGLDDVMIS